MVLLLVALGHFSESHFPSQPAERANRDCFQIREKKGRRAGMADIKGDFVCLLKFLSSDALFSQYSLVRSQIGFRFESQFLIGHTFASRT